MWSEVPSDTARDNRPQAVAGQVSLVAAANEYLARGWPVIPLVGKLPAISWKEFQTRLPTLAEVESWFAAGERTPTGVGIVTGKLSGLVVVDCDSRQDAAFWEGEHGSSSLVVETGGGGVHFYYAMPKEVEVRNRAGVFHRKIDVRGEGGYVTAPPSLHPNGMLYQWRSNDFESGLPRFEIAWLTPKHQDQRMPLTASTAQVRNALAYISLIQAVAGEGGHNATFRAACKLRDAGLSKDEAFALLLEWNEKNASPPWSAKELEHKIRSAYLPAR